MSFKCLRTPRKEVKRWSDDAENDLQKTGVRDGKIAKNIEGQDPSRTVKPVERDSVWSASRAGRFNPA